MFLENLKTIALQVVILYLISGFGFVADKTKIFTQKDSKRLVDLLFNIILPVAVIHTFMTMERTPEKIKGLLIAFVCACATHLLGIAISSLTFRKRNAYERGIYHYAITFSNAAFLAIPLAKSVIGNEGVFFCSVYVAVFNIFAFTYGISEISGKKAKMNFKKVILNPGTVSVLIGIPLFLLNLNIPDFIETPMKLVGDCNSPMAMIVFGTFLANSNFKNLIIKKELYFCSVLRLIAIPLIMLGLFYIAGIRGNMLIALTVSSCAPTATNTAMFAEKFDSDAALGSELAAQSTLLSIITMPAIVAAASVLA